jgi:hypothetical protein
VIGVLGPVFRRLGGLVAEELRVGAALLLRVPALLIRVRAQYIDEEVGWGGALDRVGLGQRRRVIAPARSSFPDVIARIRIQRRKLV